MLIAEVGQFLADEGLETYDPTGVTGTVYLECLPPVPDGCIMIRSTGGMESDPGPGYDNLGIQIIKRGPETALEATQVGAQAIYDALHGFANDRFIGGGLWIIGCLGTGGGPAYIGQDDNKRHEYSINFMLMVQNENRRL